jgi:hypothetical protein
LSDEHVELLPAHAGRFRKRTARAASGNPLFVREMLALADERGADEVALPPRCTRCWPSVDRLEPDEACSNGAVEGEIFHRAPCRHARAGAL